MPEVLTTASRITCTHGGTISPSGAAKIKVNGSPVILAAGVAGKPVPPGPPAPPPPPPATPCAVPTDPNTATKSCTSVISVTDGKASKLKVNGQPVLLQSLGGVTDGTGPKPPAPPPTPPNGLSATANQSKLTAI